MTRQALIRVRSCFHPASGLVNRSLSFSSSHGKGDQRLFSYEKKWSHNKTSSSIRSPAWFNTVIIIISVHSFFHARTLIELASGFYYLLKQYAVHTATTAAPDKPPPASGPG